MDAIFHATSDIVNVTMTRAEYAALDARVRRLKTIREFADGLRIWGTDTQKQLATDLLYLIGEN